MAEPEMSARTVLIAMDGSKHALYAFEWYINNACKDNDNVIIAHCADSNVSSCKDIGKPGSDIREQLDGMLKAANVTHAYLPLPPPAGESIVSAANENQATFIIAGSRGHGTIRRTITGSVTDYIIAHTFVPVFVCKHTDELSKLK